MRIDFVQDDDWAGVYVDGLVQYQDHSIRDDHWIELIGNAFQAGRFSDDGVLDVFKWWVRLNEHDLRYMPATFKDLQEIAGSGLESG